jgi:hypothetical protein
MDCDRIFITVVPADVKQFSRFWYFIVWYRWPAISALRHHAVESWPKATSAFRLNSLKSVLPESATFRRQLGIDRCGAPEIRQAGFGIKSRLTATAPEYAVPAPMQRS